MTIEADKAYIEIKGRIISGDLRPNTSLSQIDLAVSCGVSRSPVRDALRRLEAEMLVRRTDTQRCFVREWTFDEVEDMYALRGLLEGHAAKRAATHISAEEILELKRLNAEIHASFAGRANLDVDSFARLNREFHDVIFRAARSEPLTAMRRVVSATAPVPMLARKLDSARAARSHTDHGDIIIMLENRDADGAEVSIKSHIRHALYQSIFVAKP